jgi:hypothetical protein
MARREIKQPYTEQRMHCPYCGADLRIGTVMNVIQASQRTCVACGKVFLIENDVPKRLAEFQKKEFQKKPSKSVRTAKERRRNRSG